MDALTRDRELRLLDVELRSGVPGVGYDVYVDEEDDSFLRHRLLQVAGVETRDFNAALHPRDGEGKFRTVFARVNQALTSWAKGDGPDRPISALKLSRPSLLKVSRRIGYEPRRGESVESIEDGILARAREIDKARRLDAPDVPDVEPDAPEVEKLFTAGDRLQAERILSRLTQSEFEQDVADPSRTRKELADASRLLGLPTTGTKDALRKRLVERAAELRRIGEQGKAGQAPTRASFDEGAATEWKDVTAASSVRISNLERALDNAGGGNQTVAFQGLYRFKSDSDTYTAIQRNLFRGELRDPSDPDSRDSDRYTRGIDQAMAAGALTEDVIVYRGERNPARHFPDGAWDPEGNMEGREWTSRGFASTSVSEFYSEGYTSYVYAKDTARGDIQPTVLRIRVPAGTRAVAYDAEFDFDPDFDSNLAAEQELLLDRGLRYRVVADRGVVNGVRRLDVEVVPT